MESTISFALAQEEQLEYIYQSLKDMAKEGGVSGRFSLTRETLAAAVFSEQAFAEVLLVFSKENPAGLLLFSKTNRNFDLFTSPGIYIHDLYVSPAFRKQGLARLLMQRIKAIALERHFSRVDWIVLKNNPTAARLYKSIAEAKEMDFMQYMRIDLLA